MGCNNARFSCLWGVIVRGLAENITSFWINKKKVFNIYKLCVIIWSYFSLPHNSIQMNYPDLCQQCSGMLIGNVKYFSSRYLTLTNDF